MATTTSSGAGDKKDGAGGRKKKSDAARKAAKQTSELRRQSKMKRFEAFRDEVLETKDGVPNVADAVEDAMGSLGLCDEADHAYVRDAIKEYFDDLCKKHGF